MHFRVLICALLLTYSCFAQTGKKLNVLFIGNSYTAVNSLPQIVADIAKNMGDTLTYGIEAPGGYYFLSHVSVNPPKTINKIKAGNWDYVVLQEQSVTPAIPDDNVNQAMFPQARRLDSLINQYNNCVETIFYMTWGRQKGDSFLCDYYSKKNWPYFCSYTSMDSMIRLRYQMMADSNNAIISPVGAVWRDIRNTYPNINLYDADGSHPSKKGSYAAACSFYTTLFRKDPTKISYDYSLPPAEALEIRSSVKKVLYDSMLYWHVGQYKTEATFSYTQNNATINFNNTSTNTTSQIWDFGDGNISTSTNPQHTYLSTGKHIVRLIVNKTSCNDTSYASINIFPTHVKDITEARYTVSPNPNFGKFSIAGINKESVVSICNIYGQEVYRNTFSKSMDIDVSKVNKGLYIVIITNDGNKQYSKILIQ